MWFIQSVGERNRRALVSPVLLLLLGFHDLLSLLVVQGDLQVPGVPMGLLHLSLPVVRE